MSISTAQLDALKQKLQRLADHLREDRRAPSTVLEPTDPHVVEAKACDFLLPSPLTLAALQNTVHNKLDNVAVLSERARMHAALPADAQAAAEEENVFMEADYDTAPEPQSDGADPSGVPGPGR